MEHGKQAEARKTTFHFDDNPQDVGIILGFFLNVLLYQPITPRQASTAAESDDNSLVYPGLNAQAVLDVTNNGKVTWASNQLTDAKVIMDYYVYLFINIDVISYHLAWHCPLYFIQRFY